MIRNKFLFYFLSLTWGCIMTTIGAIVALALIVTKHKPKKWGYCWYFEVGKNNWGGMELGPFFLCNKNPSEYIKNHEAGHGHQNCIFGPLMPFVICIPSAIRYWWREILVRSEKKKRSELPPYSSIWFEYQADNFGLKFMEWYNNTK